MWMVYGVKCIECQLLYIGCNSRRLKVRIREHLYGAMNPDVRDISNASKHFRNTHNGDVPNFVCFGIEQVKTGRI